MAYGLLFTALIAIVLVFRFLLPRAERCPDCGLKREDDHPICACGWVYEFPDDGDPLEYGDPDEEP